MLRSDSLLHDPQRRVFISSFARMTRFLTTARRIPNNPRPPLRSRSGHRANDHCHDQHYDDQETAADQPSHHVINIILFVAITSFFLFVVFLPHYSVPTYPNNNHANALSTQSALASSKLDPTLAANPFDQHEWLHKEIRQLYQQPVDVDAFLKGYIWANYSHVFEPSSCRIDIDDVGVDRGLLIRLITLRHVFENRFTRNNKWGFYTTEQVISDYQYLLTQELPSLVYESEAVEGGSLTLAQVQSLLENKPVSVTATYKEMTQVSGSLTHRNSVTHELTLFNYRKGWHT